MLQPIDPDRIPLEAWLPVSKKEMEKRGWEQADIILLSGDAYVDHPSFGVAVIGRVLERRVSRWPFFRSRTGKTIYAISGNWESRVCFSGCRRGVWILW